MTAEIVPMSRRHVAGFREVLDAVARERRFLAYTEAPPLPRVRRFVRSIPQQGGVQFVAIDAGRVVGWCDIVPRPREALRHCGVLGMGLAASHRGRGLGTALLRETLAAIESRGVSRVELVVRTDNEPAIALYRRFGFETEGTLRRYLRLDGAFHDAFTMARLTGTDDALSR